jgi:hypothetical protein
VGKMSIEEMEIENKAEFLIAIRDYKYEKSQKYADGVDYWASEKTSDKRVLLRSIESQRKGGFVNITDVKNMMEVMKQNGCNNGILIGKRFTEAASQEMTQDNIQQVSDSYMPPVKPENILLIINGCTDDLCRKKCGAVPLKESDCKGAQKESICRIRAISDDTEFHFEHGWLNLLKSDLRQLLMINKSIKG